MGRYLAYLTVSNEDRGEARAELAAQEATCRSHAERNESSLFALFIDEGVGERCGLEKRPALLEAIGHLDRGELIERRKRLWRNSWNSLLETVERLD